MTGTVISAYIGQTMNGPEHDITVNLDKGNTITFLTDYLTRIAP